MIKRVVFGVNFAVIGIENQEEVTDIPPEIKKYVNNYSVHVVEVMKMQNTDMFHSDLKQIFDYIRYSKDKKKLRELVSTDSAYQEMDEEAYDILMEYTCDEKLIHAKKYQGKDGKINMCVAIREMLADEKAAGLSEGRLIGISEGKEIGLSLFVNSMKENMSIDELYEKIKMHEEYQDVTRSQIEKYYFAS